MIVVDSSAVIALLSGEPSAPVLAARLAADPDRVMSVATYLEVGTVIATRSRSDRLGAIAFLDTFLTGAEIELRPVDEAQARIALDARIRYGRGMGHGGVLNFGDTFSYALAKSLGAPLLFVGDDFTRTDIEPAVS
ncbi:MAG TPA: type II toxin-antitoxin system VapC family toxin [Stellaceae bacterium]|nr:type II toxin-antitoxin system VapC family toxin [Stellaceae bacterium]